MNIEEEKRKLEEQHKTGLKTLEACKGFENIVSHVNGEAIFIKSVAEYEEFLVRFNMVHSFLGTYKLFSYYMNNQNEIAINYSFGEIKVVFFCSDVDSVIKKLGKGKCRIEEKSVVEKSIVCER